MPSRLQGLLGLGYNICCSLHVGHIISFSKAGNPTLPLFAWALMMMRKRGRGIEGDGGEWAQQMIIIDECFRYPLPSFILCYVFPPPFSNIPCRVLCRHMVGCRCLPLIAPQCELIVSVPQPAFGVASSQLVQARRQKQKAKRARAPPTHPGWRSAVSVNCGFGAGTCVSGQVGSQPVPAVLSDSAPCRPPSAT